MKQGSLFCFVLVVRLICSKSRCFMPHSWYLQKALYEYGCTDLVWDCLELHMWKLLIIELFCRWKLNKIETEIYIVIWGWVFLCCWKVFGESDLVEFTSQFSELRCEKHLSFEWILLLEIQNNCQNWVWNSKKSVEPTMCPHCQI
jgi:hypothetical protein